MGYRIVDVYTCGCKTECEHEGETVYNTKNDILLDMIFHSAQESHSDKIFVDMSTIKSYLAYISELDLQQIVDDVDQYKYKDVIGFVEQLLDFSFPIHLWLF